MGVILRPSDCIEVRILLNRIAFEDADLIKRTVFGRPSDDLAELPAGSRGGGARVEHVKSAESGHRAFYPGPFKTAPLEMPMPKKNKIGHLLPFKCEGLSARRKGLLLFSARKALMAASVIASVRVARARRRGIECRHACGAENLPALAGYDQCVVERFTIRGEIRGHWTHICERFYRQIKTDKDNGFRNCKEYNDAN